MKTKAFLASILMLPAVAMAQISRSGNVIDSDGGDANIFDHLLGGIIGAAIGAAIQNAYMKKRYNAPDAYWKTGATIGFIVGASIDAAISQM